jgi:hypothetical protein
MDMKYSWKKVLAKFGLGDHSIISSKVTPMEQGAAETALIEDLIKAMVAEEQEQEQEVTVSQRAESPFLPGKSTPSMLPQFQAIISLLLEHPRTALDTEVLMTVAVAAMSQGIQPPNGTEPASQRLHRPESEAVMSAHLERLALAASEAERTAAALKAKLSAQEPKLAKKSPPAASRDKSGTGKVPGKHHQDDRSSLLVFYVQTVNAKKAMTSVQRTILMGMSKGHRATATLEALPSKTHPGFTRINVRTRQGQGETRLRPGKIIQAAAASIRKHSPINARSWTSGKTAWGSPRRITAVRTANGPWVTTSPITSDEEADYEMVMAWKDARATNGPMPTRPHAAITRQTSAGNGMMMATRPGPGRQQGQQAWPKPANAQATARSTDAGPPNMAAWGRNAGAQSRAQRRWLPPPQRQGWGITPPQPVRYRQPQDQGGMRGWIPGMAHHYGWQQQARWPAQPPQGGPRDAQNWYSPQPVRTASR